MILKTIGRIILSSLVVNYRLKRHIWRARFFSKPTKRKKYSNLMMPFANYRCTVDNKQIPYNKSCIIALTLFAPPSRIHLYVLNHIRSPSLFRNESDRWYSSSHTSTWHRLCRNFLSCSVDLRNVVLKHFYS